ncbi:MAG: tyrosine-type recombinase/integrase [Planctomycetes bacterium]|nr:tyrosine-type recombinase/integrase [Planctomycetota bacterium]
MSESFEEWLTRYQAHLELEGMARRTVEGRSWCLGKFIAWARELGIDSPEGLSLALLGDYRRHRIELVNARGARDRIRTVNQHLVALRDFLRVLAAKGAVPEALRSAIALVKEPRTLPKGALTHLEMMKILDCVPGDTPIHLRDRAILEVLYSTGLRRQELVDLKLPDIDLEGGVVRVECGKGAKGRIVPLGRAASEWTARYLRSARPALVGRREDGGALFVSKSGAKLQGNVIREIVARWTKAAGIDKPVTPHTFRRSCATGMIRNRVNPAHVKDLLGHDDFSSLSSYISLEIPDLKEAHKKFHPREQDEEKDDGEAGGVPAPLP